MSSDQEVSGNEHTVFLTRCACLKEGNVMFYLCKRQRRMEEGVPETGDKWELIQGVGWDSGRRFS